jgi:hypothetical protein
VTEVAASPGEVAARPGKVRTPKAAAATESTAHLAAAAEPATVSTPAPMSTATATRKRVSGQSPGESGSHSQNNHALA